MNARDLKEKAEQYRNALEAFVERLKQDRYVLAAVLVGSLSDALMWRKESIGLWIIERDGVTRRLRADGEHERIFRTFVENDVIVHAEIIPRNRFKRMIEGSSRTAFSCNFFALRKLVHCADPSIERWFEEANELATRDQEKELFAVMTWTIHEHRHANKLLNVKKDLELTRQQLIWAAYSIAATEIILQGVVYEEEIIYRAIEHNPELFQAIYLDVINKKKSKRLFQTALDRIEEYLDSNYRQFLNPLFHYLKKQQRVVPLSEIADHFAHTQLYPFHVESACEWLARKGELEKLSVPFQLTTKSRAEIEEPGYFYDS